MDYTTLVKAIKAYTENEFPETIGSGSLTSTEQIDMFIQQAEQRIFNSVQSLAARQTTTGTCVVGNPMIANPAGWLSGFSVAVIDPVTGAYDFLLHKDVDYLRSAYPDPTAEGKPTHYALPDDGNHMLAPTPDDTYTIQFNFSGYPESIVTAGNTWLGDNFDSALLYGSMLEAYTFMKGEEDITSNYRSRYDEAMTLLKQLSDGKHRQDTYRSGQARYPVR